jgi:hypothetical protein
MPDALMYQAEFFATPDELLAQLTDLLAERQADLPRDLQKFSTVAEQAKHLRDTACELDLRPGETMQWYVVRLEKS